MNDTIEIPGAEPFGAPSAPRAVQAGVIGGSSASFSPTVGGGIDMRGADATLQAVLKMGGEKLAPYVAAEQDQLFFRGVQQALTGQAVQEVVDEQPWYANLFGPSGVVDGARAYASQKAVTDWATKWQRDMPELRKVTPDKLGPVIAERMRQMTTGDALSDSAAHREMLAQLPGLVKGHAKEHFAYQQINTMRAQEDAIASSAGLLQQRQNSATLSPADIDTNERVALAVLAQPPGQTDENYIKGVSGALITAAERGNLHFINAARKHGILARLPDATATRIEASYEKFGSRAAQQMPASYTNKLFEIHRQARQLGAEASPREVMTAMAGFNREWSAHTGFQGEFFTSKQIAQEGLTALEVISQNMKQSITLNEKATSVWQKSQDIAKAVHAGVAGVLPTSYKTDRDEFALNMWNGSQPSARAQMLVKNAYPVSGPSGGPGVVFDQIKEMLQQGLQLTTSGPTDAFGKAYTQWLEVQKADADPTTGKWRDVTARAYYGKVNDAFHAYHQQLQTGMDPVAAHNVAFVEARRQGETTEAARKVIQDSVKSNWQRWFGSMFGDVPSLSDESARLLSTYLSTDYAEAHNRNPAHDPKALAESVVKTAMLPGAPFDWMGQHATYLTDGQKKIHEILGLPHNAVGSAVTDVIAAQSRTFGIDVGKAVVRRVDIQRDNPRLMVEGFKDGVIQRFYIDIPDIRKQYEKRFDLLGNPVRPKPGELVGNRPADPTQPAIFYRN